MLRPLTISLVLVSFTAGGTLRAATEPHADRALVAKRTWTNDDLERLSKIPGLISIVGQVTNENAQDVEAPAPQSMTEDPAWYAAQADQLQSRLAAQQADLQDFMQALNDVREFGSTTTGINLDYADVATTPEDTIDILQNRIDETQGELDDLEDLARQNNIAPGVLRGQW